MPTPQSSRILLVEDSTDDVFFFLRAARQQGELGVIHVSNGEEAKNFFVRRFETMAESSLPSAVVTDLKMPLCDGFELVAWLRSQPALAGMPIVVLSSSAEERDRKRALDAGANEFLSKPASGCYQPVLEYIERKWLMVARPEKTEPLFQRDP